MRPALLASLVLLVAACDSGPEPAVGGRYDVTLFRGGDVVATGRLDLDLGDEAMNPPHVSGTWRLEREGDPQVTTGGGDVRGSLDGSAVRLSLLIGEDGGYLLDAGVGLEGVVEGDVIRGEWSEGMNDGPSGTFEARR